PLRLQRLPARRSFPRPRRPWDCRNANRDTTRGRPRRIAAERPHRERRTPKPAQWEWSAALPGRGALLPSAHSESRRRVGLVAFSWAVAFRSGQAIVIEGAAWNPMSDV